MGGLGQKVDTIGMGIFNYRDRFRQLVGVLRIGMGWLVVLGSRRKCFINAMVSRNRTNSLFERYL